MIPLIYHSIYSQLPLPEGHRYPIQKYQLLYEAITQQRECDPRWKQAFQFVEPSPLSAECVKQVHCHDYIDALFSGALPAPKMRRIGFPWSETLVSRTLTSAGGTSETVEQSAKHGVAIHLSGGYHHAHKDFGSGFCLINDLVLAAKRALTLEGIEKVIVIDSDVHHGDGTATLCEQEENIVTLSFHCDKNFPARKPDSDLDVALSRNTGDEEFLSTFRSVVEMAISIHQPDLILYDAGVDIHHEDELGYFDVSTEAIYERDKFMFSLAKDNGLPIACVVGGGYRTNHGDLVPVHMQLIHAAYDVYAC